MGTPAYPFPVCAPGELETVDSSQRFPLGMVVQDSQGNLYKYVKNGEASTAFAARDVVVEDLSAAAPGTYKLSAMTDGPRGDCAVAISAIGAGKFGFVQIAGFATANWNKVATNVAAGDALAISDDATKQLGLLSDVTNGRVVAHAREALSASGALKVKLIGRG